MISQSITRSACLKRLLANTPWLSALKGGGGVECKPDLEGHERDIEHHVQVVVDTVHQQQIIIKEQENTIRNMQAQSRVTPVTYKFTSYNQHKTADDTIYSPAFYSSPRGYKMCINVDANGYEEAKNSHVSVFAFLMKGGNDDHLPWPFTGTVTIELLNQLEDNNHHSICTKFPTDNEASQRVVSEERSRSGYGRPLYISHSDLGYNAAKNCQYLKDDCLYFRINVHPQSSSTPWLI